jgi:hypothetical protein
MYNYWINNMNGIEFKAIRMYNHISQTNYAKALGLKSRRSIANLEFLDIIPERYIHILGKMIGINLLNPEIVKQAYQKALEEFKRKILIKVSNNCYYFQPQLYYTPRLPWERDDFLNHDIEYYMKTTP